MKTPACLLARLDTNVVEVTILLVVPWATKTSELSLRHHYFLFPAVLLFLCLFQVVKSRFKFWLLFQHELISCLDFFKDKVLWCKGSKSSAHQKRRHTLKQTCRRSWFDCRCITGWHESNRALLIKSEVLVRKKWNLQHVDYCELGTQKQHASTISERDDMSVVTVSWSCSPFFFIQTTNSTYHN